MKEQIKGIFILEHTPPYLCPVCGCTMQENSRTVECPKDKVAYLVTSERDFGKESKE